MRKGAAIVIFFASLFVARPALCQTGVAVAADDLALLRDAERVDHRYDDRQVVYGFTPGRRTFNPAYHLLSSAMYVYQKGVSPILQRGCMFRPSCSAYSKALLKRYGLLKGTICTADRLMRCNRVALTDVNSTLKIQNGHGHIYESTDRYR